MDVVLFLHKYPSWELGTPHWSMILHEMFLHAANRGQKEAECMVHQGCVTGPDPGAVQSAMELVEYQTSCKEIWDVCQSVYLLQRPLGIPSCGKQIRKRTIRDILSSLKDHRQRCGEDLEPQEKWHPRLNRREPYEEALRVAHQRVLDTAEALQGDIERLNLSWRNKGRSWTCSQTCSQSYSRSHSRSWSRSCSRAHSQSRPWGGSQDRQPRSPDGPVPQRRVTFKEPVEEPNSEGSVEDHLSEPSVSDVETWLEWQAEQLGTPTWWPELKAILGVTDPQKLACKILSSFYIPEVRMRVSLGQEYTMPPAPKCLSRNTFLPDELSYQDVWQQPTLLMVAYARGLQYWAEKPNLPRSPDLCPLAGSIVELRETVQEHVTFNHWDVVQGLGAIHLESTSRLPKPPCLATCCHHLLRNRILWKSHSTLPLLLLRKMWLDVPPHCWGQKERTGICWLWGSSTWNLVVITPKYPQLMKTHLRTHGLLLFSLGLPGQSVMEVPL